MGEMITTIFQSFNDVITNLAGGIKSAFENILYADPSAADKVISDPVKFALIFAGVALASGLVMGALHIIQGRK